MNGLSLKWKITLIGFIPLLFFIGLALNQVESNYKGYKEAQTVNSNLLLIDALSKIVHETQKERGLTGAFLTGGIDLYTLNEQRKQNDVSLAKLSDAVGRSSFSAEYRDEILRQVENLKEIRKGVEAKQVTVPVALKTYSSVVARFLQVELDVAKVTPFAEVSGGLRTLAIIEEAKESAGRLRAQITAILTSNEAISDTTFDALVNLKSGVDANVASPGLVLDHKMKEVVDRFKNSKEWQTVSSTFRLVLVNASVGKFHQDPKEFFSVITSAIDTLGEAVVIQKDSLVQKANVIAEESLRTLMMYLGGLVLVSVFLMFMVYKITKSVSVAFTKIANDILEESKKVSTSATDMSVNSNELSEASVEQASSLQETVSSIDEISSMVQRNAEAANSASQVSKNSTDASNRGKRTVEQMIDSIKDIAQSNDEINKIVRVITEIGEKTKVINDIVFQTKLLSFNASVEAARAGEHGKGFAVVAEEVGNLAAMSGKAAHEITNMIESSIRQVTEVVEKTKVKVVTGAKTAEECGEALDEIQNNVSSVNEMIKEIATASNEQAAGVREVTTAMQQLDQTTNQNTSVAQKTSAMAHSLEMQAERLNDSAIELIKIITGKKIVEVVESPKRRTEESANNIIKLESKKKTTAVPHKQSLKKASGSDVQAPTYNDSRFEDL